MSILLIASWRFFIITYYFISKIFIAKFFRITGLDPAGPQFELTESIVHLVETDADFVDVIHTDAGNENRGFSGFEAKCGHADFYPNGGFTVS